MKAKNWKLNPDTIVVFSQETYKATIVMTALAGPALPLNDQDVLRHSFGLECSGSSCGLEHLNVPLAFSCYQSDMTMPKLT